MLIAIVSSILLIIVDKTTANDNISIPLISRIRTIKYVPHIKILEIGNDDISSVTFAIFVIGLIVIRRLAIGSNRETARRFMPMSAILIYVEVYGTSVTSYINMPVNVKSVIKYRPIICWIPKYTAFKAESVDNLVGVLLFGLRGT